MCVALARQRVQRTPKDVPLIFFVLLNAYYQVPREFASPHVRP